MGMGKTARTERQSALALVQCVQSYGGNV